MKNKGVQHFSKANLENTKGATPDQIIQFLEDFRNLHYGQRPSPSKLISIRIPQDLLGIFKKKAQMENLGYQIKIKELMRKWVG